MKTVWISLGEVEVPNGYDEDAAREAIAEIIIDGGGKYYENESEE